MSTREKIFSILDSNKGTYFSGEQLASELGVSRAAIWKAIKTLQKSGYKIDAVTNKGYALSCCNDVLNESHIRSYLKTDSFNLEKQKKNEVTSTNQIAKDDVLSGKYQHNNNHIVVILSDKQTKGRGHGDHKFFSPDGTGLYMSLLLMPCKLPFSKTDSRFLTCIGTLSMCKALIDLSNKKIGIKWLNDLFLDKKKISGVLTEGAFDMDTGFLEYAVVGCGVNLYPPSEGFPDELQKSAGYVWEEKFDDARNKICALFLDYFLGYYERFLNGDKLCFAKEYEKLCNTLGKTITVHRQNSCQKALVLELDSKLRLHVLYNDGKEDYLTNQVSNIVTISK